MLDVNDARDLFALHFIFMPVIQQQLDLFRHGWAHHMHYELSNTEHHNSCGSLDFIRCNPLTFFMLRLLGCLRSVI